MADDWTVQRALDFLADYFQGVASGSADNDLAPLKVGGKYNATKPTLTDGQRGDAQLGTRGALIVQLSTADGVTTVTSRAASDGSVPVVSGLDTNSYRYGFNGATWDRLRTPNVFKPVLNVAVVAGTPQVIWTPAAGKKFRLMGLALSLSVAGFLSLDDGASVLDLVRVPAMPAGQGIDVETFGNGLLSALANNTLRVDVSANGNVNGMVWGTEE